jgi:NAD(P)-dependent dehydrogenase (short-subunit alcohol dehydrogenase family)
MITGFGRVLSLGFAAAGANVAMCDIDEDGRRETLAMLEKAGGSGHFARVDVSDEDQVAAFVDDTVARYGALDAAVNNACGEVPGPTLDLPSSTFDNLVATNLKGVYNEMRHQVRVMRESDGRAIVNQASVTSTIEGEENNGLYGATKGAVNALTMSAAVQVAREGIRINAIASALHDTPGDVWHRYSTTMGIDFDHFKGFVPLKRYGTADEIVGATMFLCSDASGFVVGEVLVCDGGWTISAPGSFP